MAYMFFSDKKGDMDNDFDKDAKKIFSVMIGIWVIGALLSLGLTVTVIWGIIYVLTHLGGWIG